MSIFFGRTFLNIVLINLFTNNYKETNKLLEHLLNTSSAAELQTLKLHVGITN